MAHAWSVYGWGECVCLSVSVYLCLSGLKSWITFDGMKGSWWNFQDQFNSLQVISGQGCQISCPQWYSPEPITACFYKIHLLPELLSYRDVTYLFGNLETRAKKCREQNFEFWAGAWNIWAWMGGYPQFFWVRDFEFLHKIDPPTIKF
jgi:hypothetical protein